MSFRARIAIAAAAAVALAVVLISVVVFFVVRDQLRSQVDEALNNRADQIAHIPIDFESGGGSFTLLRPGFGEPSSVMQVVRGDGKVLNPLGEVRLPVPDAAVSVANGRARRASTPTPTSPERTRACSRSSTAPGTRCRSPGR